MEIKPTFSNDRSKKLEHYGVKGMKWGRRKKELEEFASDVEEIKREWSGDKGLSRINGTVKQTVKAAHRAGFAGRGKQAKARAELGRERIKLVLVNAKNRAKRGK